VIDTPQLRRCMQALVTKNAPFSAQRSLHTSKLTNDKDWDTVSVESSYFDEGSSAESKLFPFLSDEKDSFIKAADNTSEKTVLQGDSISSDKNRYKYDNYQYGHHYSDTHRDD
jgi:hypothetical protein